MPVPKGGRVRVRTTRKGGRVKKVRLTFNRRGKVVEAKKLKKK